MLLYIVHHSRPVGKASLGGCRQTLDGPNLDTKRSTEIIEGIMAGHQPTAILRELSYAISSPFMNCMNFFLQRLRIIKVELPFLGMCTNQGISHDVYAIPPDFGVEPHMRIRMPLERFRLQKPILCNAARYGIGLRG